MSLRVQSHTENKMMMKIGFGLVKLQKRLMNGNQPEPMCDSLIWQWGF
jgi:hypothetical protein